MCPDGLKLALANAERDAEDLEIRQIAHVIGSFPVDSRLRQWVSECQCPRMQALIAAIEPCRDEYSALIWLAGFVKRQDVVGAVAVAIHESVRS